MQQTVPITVADDLAAVRKDSLVVLGDDGRVSLYHDGSPPEVIRARIQRLGDWLLSQPDPLTFHVEHEVCEGMYLRKLFIPKDSLVVGRVHRKHCHNVVASGRISVLTETGSALLDAGFTGMSQPGTQKLGFAHEDTIFINVFRTDKTDLAEIEAEIAEGASAREIKELVCL